MIVRLVNVASVLIVGAAVLYVAIAWLASKDSAPEWTPGEGEVVSADFLEAVSTGNRFGSDEAPVVLLLYSDYNCTFCWAFDRTLRVVMKRYPQHLAVVVKSFTSLANNASTRLFLATECAAEQGVFEAFHTAALRMSENRRRVPGWKAVADSVRPPDRATFDRCVIAAKYVGRIESDYLEGLDLGVRGTPTYFINGRPYFGARDVEGLDSAVALALPRAQTR